MNWIKHIFNLTRLIVKLSFHIYILTQLNYLSWIFWLNSILILSQSLIWVLNSTRQAIKYDVKRAKYRKFFRFFAFALAFCIIFLIESHEEKHEDYLIKSHDEKTWRLFDRKSWREVMKKSHEEESWRKAMKKSHEEKLW